MKVIGIFNIKNRGMVIAIDATDGFTPLYLKDSVTNGINYWEIVGIDVPRPKNFDLSFTKFGLVFKNNNKRPNIGDILIKESKIKSRTMCSWENINVPTAHSLITIPARLDSNIKYSADRLSQKNVSFKETNPSSSMISKVTGETMLSQRIYNDFLNFQKLFNKPVEVKIQSHQEDSCKLFHCDHILVRMITTYTGPTTEIVDYDNVNWDQLGTNWTDFEEYNCRILKDRKAIYNLEPMYSHILFGAKSEKHPCIHRAPDIENKGLKRLTAIMTIGS